MMRARAVPSFIFASITLLGLSASSVALAEEEKSPATPAGEGATPAHAEKAEEGAKKEGEEDRWHAGIDVVFGFGATPVVSQRIQGPLLSNESRTAESARYQTTSVNLGLSYELLHDFRVGALLPVGAGSVIPNETRGATVVGNFTLGGEYEMHPSKTMNVGLGVEVALPTASGDQLPEGESLQTGGHLNQTSLDRFSLLRAMSASRGREDTASFSPNHLGLVPKVGVLYTGMEKIDLELYAKYESLHAVKDVAAYEGAIVVAGRASYHLTKTVDGTVRVWTNIGVAGEDGTVAVAEPQLSARVGWLNPMVGVVLPFAGELTNPYSIGVRAAVAARF